MIGSQRRRRAVLAVVTAVAVLAGAVTFAWLRRTAPPWPAVAGTPYQIALASDGCPIIDERNRFVDSPGQLAPPGATQVLLCTTPTGLHRPQPGDPPRQRWLRIGAYEFTDLLNQLPDRNQTWRQWQRRHSGWWPDAAPAPIGEACFLIGYSHYPAFRSWWAYDGV